MSYQKERDQFIAQVTREGLPLWAAEKLLAAATTLNRFAELACSSEAADRDRVPCPAIKSHKDTDCCCDYNHEADQHSTAPRYRVREAQLERRIAAMLAGINTLQNGGLALNQERPRQQTEWIMDTQGDPRGYVLRVIPPSYAERNAGRDRFNREAVGVPARDRRLRF